MTLRRVVHSHHSCHSSTCSLASTSSLLPLFSLSSILTALFVPPTYIHFASALDEQMREREDRRRRERAYAMAPAKSIADRLEPYQPHENARRAGPKEKADM